MVNQRYGLGIVKKLIWPEWPGEANWLQLRPVGNLIFLKISYLALILIPVIIKSDFLASSIFHASRIDLITIYLTSISLAVANILYDVFCPTVIKRFESPNDLYHKMLEIKKLSLELYPEDNFNGSIKHCKDKFLADKQSKPNIGRLARLLFLIALISYASVFIKRTAEVLFL